MKRVANELAIALTPPPTREEFKAALNQKSGVSAGGFTLCTYQMMKTWTEEYFEAAYLRLEEMWYHKHIPEWWKWRWLHPIPKVASNVLSLEILRPIMLIEVTRKLWHSITFDRIR